MMENIQALIGEIMKSPQFNQVHHHRVKEITAFPEIAQFLCAHSEEISAEMLTNSMSKLNEFMRECQAQSQGKPGINPGYRPTLFINQNFIDVTYVATEQHRIQLEKKRKADLLDNRMMSAEVKQANLKEFESDTPSRQNALKEVLDFIQVYEATPHQARGLYLTGPFGTGKTYLLGALANYLVSRDIAVTMLHYPTYANQLKNTFKQQNTQEAIDVVKYKPVLMIDDIGAESNNGWLRDDVLNVILEYRMKEQLPTFFTSNFTMDELKQHLASTKESVDFTKASRLMERIYYLSKEVMLDGENRRRAQR